MSETAVEAAPEASGDPPPKRRREVMIILPGLMTAMLLAMLDNMIVGTAMPRIVGELGGLTHFSWVITAYVLGSTVSTPIWGKVGDLYGRKTIFLASIVLFLLGSALCGAAGSSPLGGTSHGMTQLIAFRAFQGLGAGGLTVNAFAIIGDLVPPRERGRYQGVMASVMAVAMIAGPLTGGFITDHLSWRWAFYVNLPIGLATLAFLAVRLRLPRYRATHRIDWLGAGLLGAGITALVLITTWGGNAGAGGYAWGSRQIVGLAVVAVTSLAAIVYLTLMGMEDSRPYSHMVLVPDRKLTTQESEGLKVWFERDCAYCHHILGKGGRREGPDLSNVIPKDRTREWLIRYIRDPKAVRSWTTMPKYDLTEGELNALADFILTLDFDRYEPRIIQRKQIIPSTSSNND